MATTYASVDAVETFLAAGDWMATMPTKAEDKEAVIRDAEADVDRILSATMPRDPATGRKLILAALSAAQKAALERAVCAQVAWRLEVGDEALAGIDDDLTGVPGVGLTAQTRPPSPAAVEALAGLGFPWRSGTVAPAPSNGEALEELP
jgi:hypothetical protein